MKVNVLNGRKLFVSAALVLGVAACGGGGGDDDSSSGSSGNASAGKAVSNTVIALGSSVGNSSADVFARPATLPKGQIESSVTVNCELGGTATIDAVVTWVTSFLAKVTNTFATDADITLNDCDSTNGSLTMAVAGTSNYPNFNYTAAISGSVTDSSEGVDCTVDTSGLTYEVNSNWDTGSYTALVSGSASGTCGDETVTCTWNSVNTSDEAAVEAGCGL